MPDFVAIAICAVICRAENSVEAETFGKAKPVWLDTVLTLSNGIPPHDTVGRVVAALDREQIVAQWAGDVLASKANQPTLHEAAVVVLAEGQASGFVPGRH